MPRRSKIAEAPEEFRRALDERIVGSGFGDYRGAAAWAAAQGYKIGKSSVARHGADLQRRYEDAMADARALRELTVASGSLAESASDIAAGAALILQTQLARTVLDLREEEDPSERAKLVSRLAQAQAQLGRAAISVERYKQEQAAARAKEAAAVTALCKQAGVSDEMAEALRQKFLGTP